MSIVTSDPGTVIASSLKVLYICPRPANSQFQDKSCKETIAKSLGISQESLHTVHPAKGEKLPDDVSYFAGSIIGGSKLSVNDNHEFIDRIKETIGELINNNIPLLGICFGMQLIATFLGGKVEKGKSGWETGITQIKLTDEGKNDLIFDKVEDNFTTPTAHEEVVTVLPSDGIELAYNDNYRNQAVRFNKSTWGIQFHPERTKGVIDIENIDLSNAQKIPRNFANQFLWQLDQSQV